MNPINKNSNNEIISSQSIVWEGPNIPCLELCTGEKVDSVIAKIGEKLCTLVSDIKELETLDYTCMVSKFDYTGDLLIPEKFSFKLLFKLLLENDCTLIKLIEDIKTNSTSSSVNLTGLDLKCITNEILNLCGQIPDQLDILKVTQAIINILCDIQDDVADILIRVLTLETKINSLGDPGSGGYEEPEITSCLSTLDGLGNPIPTLISTHVPQITDDAICDLRGLVGSALEVNDVLNSQPLSDYVGDSNVIQNPLNLAQASANREYIIGDLLSRLKTIEDNCCSFTCGDIKIGFIQSFSNNIYTIDFTYGAGTNIPQVFVDCGSTFILTDWKGVEKIVNNNPNTLTNASQFTIDLAGSGLDASKPIKLQIKTCFTNTQNGLICKDCFGGTLDAGSVLVTNTCWNFYIPDTDVLGCSNKFLNYVSIDTTDGIYNFSSSNTSSNGTLNLPITNGNTSMSNMVVCNSNTLKMNISGQSTIHPPIIKLLIANTSPSLFISCVGTLNPTCLC
jgi:hypothetical protein